MQITGDKGKKYGLQMPPKKKSQIPSIFSMDDEEETQEDMARQRAEMAKRRDKVASNIQSKIMEEDPTVYQYDELYDDMKQNEARAVSVQKRSTGPKYITGLLEQAALRKKDQELANMRKMARESAAEEALYGKTEKFVTAGYKKKLAEQQREDQIQQRREQLERKQAVEKRGMMNFYANAMAMASGSAVTKTQAHRDTATHEAHVEHDEPRGGSGDSDLAQEAGGLSEADKQKIIQRGHVIAAKKESELDEHEQMRLRAAKMKVVPGDGGGGEPGGGREAGRAGSR